MRRGAAAARGESNKNVGPNNGKRIPRISQEKEEMKKKNKKRKAEATFVSRKEDESSDMSISPRDDTRELSRKQVSLEALEPPLESSSYTLSARTSEQFSFPSTVHDKEIDEIAEKYTAPSSGSHNWSSTGISGLDYVKPPVNSFMACGNEAGCPFGVYSRASEPGSSGWLID